MFEFVKMLVNGLKVAFLVIVVKKKKSVIRGANNLYCFYNDIKFNFPQPEKIKHAIGVIACLF